VNFSLIGEFFYYEYISEKKIKLTLPELMKSGN